MRHTGGRGDAERFAREAARSGAAAVVAVGGDGTFHEVVNGIASAAAAAEGTGVGARADAGRLAAAACIPIGTGNDFVKSLGLAPEVEPCFQAIRGGRRRRIDLGRFVPAGGAPRVFANQVQIGYGGEVVHDMSGPHSFLRTWLPGHSAYVVMGLLRLSTVTPALESEVADGTGAAPVARSGRFFEVHIANGRYCGGGISYVPMAEVDDGVLDLVSLAPRSVLWRFKTMMQIRDRKLVQGEGIERHRARRVDVRLGAAYHLSADGESYDVPAGRLAVEVVPGAIDVLAP